MAILAIVNSPGITKTQYESLRPHVKWETEHPTGAILHSSAFDEKGGLHVVDVWNSEAEMKQYFEKRLLPAMQKSGITPPEPKIYPLHNLNIFPSAEKHKAKGK